MTNWTFDQPPCKHNASPPSPRSMKLPSNPVHSPIIIIQKFNRTNPGKGVGGGRGLGYLRGWQRWLNISFIRNRCWMAGFYRFRLPRKMAAIFTFYNSLWFIRHCKIGTTIYIYVYIFHVFPSSFFVFFSSFPFSYLILFPFFFLLV